MKKILLKLLSFIGLGLTIIPAALVFSADIDTDTCKQLMFLGTVLWFVTAPLWMNEKDAASEEG